jgi:hypothetical protein
VSDLTWSGLLKNRPVRYAVAIALVLEVAALALALVRERASRKAEQAQMAFNRNPSVWWREHEGEAIQTPPTVAPDGAGIGADEAIVGVIVDGKARAYLLESLRHQDRHLVNDLIAGIPVSVAYCNLTDCVRVFTDQRSSTPLDIQVAGLLNLEMVLKIRGTLYFQGSGAPVEPGKASTAAIPYPTITPIRTTWGQWVKDHPETDLYVGEVAGKSEAR